MQKKTEVSAADVQNAAAGAIKTIGDFTPFKGFLDFFQTVFHSAFCFGKQKYSVFCNAPA